MSGCILQWVPALFPGVKAAGAWCGVDHPPPSSAEVKERAELCLCYPQGLHGLFKGETVPLPVAVWSLLSMARHEGGYVVLTANK